MRPRSETGVSRRFAACALAIALALAPPAQAGGEAARPDQPVSALDSSLLARLIDPGLEPRAVVRFSPPDGQEATLHSRVIVELRLDRLDRKVPALSVAMPVPFTIDKLAVSTNDRGGIAWRSEPLQTGVTGDAITTLRWLSARSWLAEPARVRRSGRCDPRGMIVGESDELPGGAGPAPLQAQYDPFFFTLPFPAEPVGEGARWMVDKFRMPMLGDFAYAAEFNLREWNGREGVVEMRLRMLEPPKWATPESMDKEEVEAVGFTSRGGGTMAFTTDRLLFKRREIDSTAELTLRVPKKPELGEYRLSLRAAFIQDQPDQRAPETRCTGSGECYTRCHHGHDADGCLQLALLYERNSRYRDADVTLAEACKFGDPSLCFRLGCHAAFTGSRDEEHAAGLFKAACKGGEPRACRWLAARKGKLAYERALDPGGADEWSDPAAGGLVVRPESDVEQPAQRREAAPPEFSEPLRRLGFSGRVFLELTVDDQGAVRAARVVRTDNPALDAPALECVRRWRFDPARDAGGAVAVRKTVSVQFELF